MSVRSNVSIAAFVLSAISLQAMPPSCRPLNSFEQGYELRQNQMMAAYNATARIDVRGSWDLYTTGTYIYWQPREENLELGISNHDNVNDYSLPIDGRVINMNFRYKSGIQAGLGIYSDRDNWDAYGEYTWLAGRHYSAAKAPLNGSILPFWGHPANIAETTIVSAKSRWKLEMNIGDAILGRSYYVGTKLTFRPFFGARAAWINQKYLASYHEPSVIYHVYSSSHSWGLGAEAGVRTHWLLGYGIRIIGSAEADILFTRYNLHMKEQDSATPTLSAVSLHQRHIFYLRPHSDIEFGFGWGSYMCNHNYHIDLLATYGFQIFWNQNMFRSFVDYLDVGKSYAPGGDLYIHGVTGEIRLDY